MPELPEIEIVKQSLQSRVINKKIKYILIKNRNLRYKIEKNFENLLSNKKIVKISRKAKYLILHISNMKYLVIHCGMSGTFHIFKKRKKIKRTNLSFYNQNNLIEKHNHIIFFFSNFLLIYNDPRRFGFIKLINSKIELDSYLSKMGPEPYDCKFTFNYLKNKFYKKKINIKNFLINQKYISGLGNIYASEILYYSKINPNRLVKNLSDNDVRKLKKNTIYVLDKAIAKGGSTIRDFKNIKGNKGSYQEEFKVYDREGKKCSSQNCKEKIIRILISNRSTYLCKKCQK